jgi:hypothetical protein
MGWMVKLGFDSWQGEEIFLFFVFTVSRLALGPNSLLMHTFTGVD